MKLLAIICLFQNLKKHNKNIKSSKAIIINLALKVY